MRNLDIRAIAILGLGLGAVLALILANIWDAVEAVKIVLF